MKKNIFCLFSLHSTLPFFYKTIFMSVGVTFDVLKPGMWKRKQSFFCGSGSAKIPLLPHRREECRKKRNWFCYPSEKSEWGEHKH